MGGSHGRLTEWTLVSRIRYGLVWGTINALVVLGVLTIMQPFSFERALVFLALCLCIGVPAQAFIWYPRAKRKFIEQQH